MSGTGLDLSGRLQAHDHGDVHRTPAEAALRLSPEADAAGPSGAGRPERTGGRARAPQYPPKVVLAMLSQFNIIAVGQLTGGA
jgi:hypothetical protein